MSKNRGRGRGGRDRLRDRPMRDPIIDDPRQPEPQEPGLRLISGTYNQLADVLIGSSWGGNLFLAQEAALAYGYDGGATEYFAYGRPLLHYQFGPLLQVAYVMPNGVATSTLIPVDYEAIFATDSPLA